MYRARATANYLTDHDWDVTVFTAPTPFFREIIGSVDDTLASSVDPRIRVERPAMRYFPWERDVRRFRWLRAHLPTVARWAHGWAQHHLFPEKYSSWVTSCVTRALALHARQRFDVVVATGNPFAAFAVAWALRRLTGVPYVLDYRDSWTLDQFTDAPAFPDGHPAWRWERRVLAGASAVTFVNEAQRRWHADRYPSAAQRMQVVSNGLDPELLSNALPRAASASGPLRFSFVGTVTAGQAIEELAEAFVIARREPGLADAELNLYGYLGFFHHSPQALAARLASGPAGDVIRYHGPVPKSDVSNVYRNSDVLVFMTSGGRYVTTGKVFEYMGTGLPIVSVHAPDIAAREVLTGYPLWFDPGGLDVRAIAGAMVTAGAAARNLDPEVSRAAQRHAAQFSRDRALAELDALLRRTVRTRAPRDRSRP